MPLLHPARPTPKPLRTLLTGRARAGRHRWVVFADAHDYSARGVPREWHGALRSAATAREIARSRVMRPQAGCTR